ncbi:MAG: 4-(cytidine 5'-diphospho)-2-C-methyl-D-erythritol kinase [Mycobacteriales bacterium]
MLAGVPAPVTVRAAAKVNLCLRVGARRADGYHEISTVYQAVSLHDEVTATPARDITISVRGDGVGDVPVGEDNLAVRAARLLASRAEVSRGVHLDLVKAIPVAGGMAGGSADAAAALVACDALWDTGLDREGLTALAAELGSDVPFVLHGGIALGTGRGERLTEVLSKGRYHWVFALSAQGLATSDVYAAYDRLPLRSLPVSRADPDSVLAALRTGDPVALGPVLANDLQSAAVSLVPALRRVLATAPDLGALAAVVSGSGPTVALLARDGDDAARLAVELSGLGVAHSIRVAHGPVAGARLVDQVG